MPGSCLVVLPSGETDSRASIVKLSQKQKDISIYNFPFKIRLAEDDILVG